MRTSFPSAHSLFTQFSKQRRKGGQQVPRALCPTHLSRSKCSSPVPPNAPISQQRSYWIFTLLATNHSLAGRSGSVFQVRYPNPLLCSTESLAPSSINSIALLLGSLQLQSLVGLACSYRVAHIGGGAAEPEWAQQSAYVSRRTRKGMISSTNLMLFVFKLLSISPLNYS
ncbi:hypothetical protein SAY87_007619 [Trapa incisa]|uniref:Uncharacterized protein n=1 Tax=Trapa incisa TaxID=236973 RepID=A0AAN7QF65_9MYRT|nr:hypothetical protein SAY87_007619 [Trapa incisa]